jgi:hypothetical protein
MGRDCTFILKTNEAKLNTVKNLIENRLKELDPESLVDGDINKERQDLKESVLLMGLLNDINNSTSSETIVQEVHLVGTADISYCWHCRKETPSFKDKKQNYGKTCCVHCDSIK